MKERVRQLNRCGLAKSARWVLYWAQMNRRVDSNHGLAFAIELANEQRLPVLFYEGLTYTYPYASDRFHTFVLEGVPETARRLARAGIGYVFYLRRTPSDPDDVLYRLAQNACAIVTDDYPVFVAAAHNRSVPAKVPVPYFVVDSSCIVPMRTIGQREYAAYTIRPKILRSLPQFLHPAPNPTLERDFTEPVPEFHIAVTEDKIADLVAECQIDHSVRPSLWAKGGRLAAENRLEQFLLEKLPRYPNERNQPAAHATSGLSPYLHFGHIGALETALTVRRYAQENGLQAEEFLEELIVRRELAFNYAYHGGPLADFGGLPGWARQTMARHAADGRDPCYSRAQFEAAATHDRLWNAAQKELLLRGTIHGYYRMYWGKKILEWSASYEEALQTMIYLNDRYALDGRDPNTYTNILWCFGLHDRPWPERPIYGKIRSMSLQGMERKTDVAAYIQEIDWIERTGSDPFGRQSARA